MVKRSCPIHYSIKAAMYFWDTRFYHPPMIWCNKLHTQKVHMCMHQKLIYFIISIQWFIDTLILKYQNVKKKKNCHINTYPMELKGKFSQTTMWIGWVECNFTNPTVKVWADLDNPFKRSDYAKLCMSPSLDGTLPEYVISQEDNSLLTLYIDFQFFLFFSDINSPFVHVRS